MRPNQRGSTLIIAMIVIVVITAIGVGIIRFSGLEVAGAAAAGREQSLVACAEAARQALLSQFHTLGTHPAEITVLNLPLDGADDTHAQRRAVGGHYDGTTWTNPDMTVTLGQVSYLPPNAFGPTTAVRDITNVISSIGQPRRPIKIIAHCQEGGRRDDPASGRQLEVEVGVRFGL